MLTERIKRHGPQTVERTILQKGEAMKKIATTLAVILAVAISTPAMASDATGIVEASARQHGVPVPFALRIAHHESGVRCGVWGDHGRSGGPLQIYYPTARSMGVGSYKNFRRMSCAALTDLGMRYLAQAYRAAKGNEWLAAVKHNGGIAANGRSRKNQAYAAAVLHGKPVRVIRVADVQGRIITNFNR